MNPTLPVYWQGHLVGQVTITATDMWYQSGIWVPGDGDPAAAFLRLLAQLDPLDTKASLNKNLERQLWVGVGQDRPTHLVIGCAPDCIELRLMSHPPESW
jgi:hypothetical protein